MIRLKAISIRELRGIRELDLMPGGESYVVFGPNGSGKSGVVDAVEFALTGNISRLSGPGTSGVTVSRHGPHVARRDDPSASMVKLVLEMTDNAQEVTVTRRLSATGELEVDPDTPETRKLLAEASRHPEVVLSRREIMRFVVTEPGTRSKEIQALLRLEQIGSTRSTLKTAQNRSAASARQASTAHAESVGDLARHLDHREFDESVLLRQVNLHRSVLGLEELDSLTSETVLSQGAIFGSSSATFNKTSAIRDIEALEAAIAEEGPVTPNIDVIVNVCAALAEKPELRELLVIRPFLQKGLDLIDSTACPLCDETWASSHELEEHLRGKLAKSEAAQLLVDELTAAVAGLRSAAEKISGLSLAVGRIASHLGDRDGAEVLSLRASDVVDFAKSLGTFEGALDGLGRLGSGWIPDIEGLSVMLVGLRASVGSAPDQSEKSASLSFLSVAEERWAKLNSSAKRSETKSNVKAAAALAYRSYCEESEVVLGTLYQQVEDTFTAYYRLINSDNESEFKAKFEPSEGKLDLAVDFYGQGMFPPVAYHSEGHQDGMGVCLYLALMKQLLGDRFTFALLDDVVMSVDSGHRKQFCELLKTEFPATQFIITTHDKAWARQMRYQGLVTPKTSAQFHGWSVDAGPIYEQETDVWVKIAEEVESDDIPAAAARLRRHLEFVCTELAEQLGAKVPYRADGDHDLGELLSAVVGKHGELIKLAKKSAKSWGNSDAEDAATALDQRRKTALAQNAMEQWIVNKAVHYNEWADFDKADFEPAVDALKDLLDLFRCEDCDEWLSLSGSKFNPDALRCRCSARNFNLATR